MSTVVDVLNSWIMFEHLKEGKLDKKGAVALKGDDFYSMIKSRTGGGRYSVGVYLGVFDFNKVVGIIQSLYDLRPSPEEIPIGKKFTLALYFDKSMNFLGDLTMFTASGYIKAYGEIPDEATFENKVSEINIFLKSSFMKIGEDQEGFNILIKKLIGHFGGESFVKQHEYLESSVNILRSFFIKDIKTAKTICPDILCSYLCGFDEEREERVDLNSNSASDRFDPEIFRKILQPRNYPTARFPGNTKYALCFMQQVAVNLAISDEDIDIRSVNGPPGTGKTTLLKDVFAELVVRQAYSIVKMSDRVMPIDDDDRYSVGKLPECIAENGIVVASSNNGAVQNIVKELPLLSGIDDALRGELLEADYFHTLSNSRIETAWIKDRNGRSKCQSRVIPVENAAESWGLFSLEGGRKENMTNMINYIYEICNDLDKNYKPDTGVYFDFLNMYNAVVQYRNNVQKYSELPALTHITESVERFDKLKEVTRIKDEIAALTEELNKCQADLKKWLDYKPGFFERHDRKWMIKRLEERLWDINKKLAELNVRKDELERRLAGMFVMDNDMKMINMHLGYEDLQFSNPWFGENYRIMQSKLFIAALKVRKQFLYENRANIRAAAGVWNNSKKLADKKDKIKAAWEWINFTIPVISSTFASFANMTGMLGVGSIGHLFVDEAGQAVPHFAVGAVMRSRRVMVVGDPYQIKPVLELDPGVVQGLAKRFEISPTFLSDSASVQTLADRASKYGFFRSDDEGSYTWVGVPLWVHRRCMYPMFTISNEISYQNLMVQGKKEFGKTGWFDVSEELYGSATDPKSDKYMVAQGEFLIRKIQSMIEADRSIIDKTVKDKIYVISPFEKVASLLANKLDAIHFTRRTPKGAPTNVGTIHTFQGKEAPIVFLVLGANNKRRGSAWWAVSEANMINVAATRAKEEFYIIGDKKLYKSVRSRSMSSTIAIMDKYAKEHPKLIDDDVKSFLAPAVSAPRPAPKFNAALKAAIESANKLAQESAPTSGSQRTVPESDGHVTGTVTFFKSTETSAYAYIQGDDGNKYTITESIYSKTENAADTIYKNARISFTPSLFNGKRYAHDVRRG